MTDELLTIDEAARIAHVSPETIRYWFKVGRIPRSYARISARSSRPHGLMVRRADLLNSLTASKIGQLEKELNDELLNVNQLATRLALSRDRTRSMLKKLKPKRYYPQNPREFVVALGEVVHLMDDDDWYFIEAIKFRKSAAFRGHSCEYCS